jgi:hypothetical protein
MFFLPNGQIRLTPGELNEIRSASARVDHVMHGIRTRDELLKAIFRGMPNDLAADMLEFMEAGSSPLTQGIDSD